MGAKFREVLSGGKGLAVAVVVGVLLVGMIAWASFRRPSNNANFPEGTWWLCKNGHSFTMTIKQLGEWNKAHYGQSPQCPTCKAEAERAEKCPHCGTVSPAQRNSTTCPKCGQPLARPGD